MGPWGPLGLFRSHSEWKAISSRGFFRKKSIGPEILQNATKTNHLKHLGGLGLEIVQRLEIVQNGTKTNPFRRFSAFQASSNNPFRGYGVFQASFNNPSEGLGPSKLLQITPFRGYGVSQASFNNPFGGFWAFQASNNPSEAPPKLTSNNPSERTDFRIRGA